MAGAAEHLPGEKPRPIDREEHPAQTAGPHRLDVDALRQHRHLSTADQRHVAGLVEHRLADREQHDHHAHADREAEQQEERAELPDPEVAERESEEHQPSDGAVEHVDHPARLGGEPVVVGHHDQRRAVGVEPAEEVEDLAAGRGVELAGRLVGEEHAGRLASARAIATRCISPPESWVARCPARWPGRHTPAARARGPGARRGGTPASAIGSSTFSRAVSTGSR